MKKISYIFLIIALTVLIMKVGYACYSKDAGFKFQISGLKINISKLEKLCVTESCTIDQYFIIMKSHYDNRVKLSIRKHVEENGSYTLMIELPFTLDNKQNPVMGTIDPEQYNWKESVKADLAFLKNADVLDIAEADIEIISGLAKPYNGVVYCEGQWRLTGIGCFCSEDGILCPNC